VHKEYILFREKCLPFTSEMKKLLSILFILLTCFSCEKEEYSYSGWYVSQSTEMSAIRLFTVNGEITNANLVNAYLDRTENGNLYREINNPPDVVGKYWVVFENEKADFSVSFFKLLPLERNVKRKGKYIYLEETEISTVYNITDESFENRIITHFPLYSITTPLPASSGFTSKTDFKHCIYLEGKRTEIVFPLMAYVYKKHIPGGEYNYKTSSSFNNEFNKGVVGHLSPGDTLAVQETRIILVKQLED
jgi:hypothetical protein